MTRLRFDYDFSYEAATGRPWREVVEELIHEASKLAVARLRAIAPTVSGRLAGSHEAVPGRESATIRNTVRYAEFVLPRGSRGRWRWWMGREMRNAFEDVSLQRFGDVEEAVLVSIGPTPRVGHRSKMQSARLKARREAIKAAGTSELITANRIIVPVRAQRSSPRAPRTSQRA